MINVQDLLLLVITILLKLIASVSFVNCLVARHNDNKRYDGFLQLSKSAAL